MRKSLPSPRGCVDYPLSVQIQDTIRAHGVSFAWETYRKRGLPFWEFYIFAGEWLGKSIPMELRPGLRSQLRVGASTPLLPAPHGVHVWPIGHSL